ncbi:MAG: uroporphyrinogen-III synthase [Deltaproteobacteria bacterium]
MDVDASADSAALAGVRILTLESRRKVELTRLLARHGAEVLSAPALREEPLEETGPAVGLLERLRAGQIDALILLTGVGTHALATIAARHGAPEEFAELLGRIPLIARGPKPVAALRQMGLRARVRAPEPNTWRELLGALDAEFPVAGLRLAVQEYGRPSPELHQGLEDRGASVYRVPVYRYALPEDTAPLAEGIGQLLAGRIHVVAFTTAVQLDHLLLFAGERRAAVARALRDQVLVASIGPTVDAALAAEGIAPNICPEHPKLGYFAKAIAAHAPTL